MLLHEIPGKELSITEDSADILTYCYGTVESPPHFHPLYAPNGQVVTADTQATQRPPGLCFQFGTVNGAPLRQEDVTRERVPSAVETRTEFTLVTTWRASELLLVETCTTVVHPRQTDVQALDISISLHAPRVPLEFAGNTGLGYYAVEMEYRKAVNAHQHIGESEVNGKVSTWGTLCGITTAEQEGVGVAIFPHPANGQTTFLAADASFGFLFAQAAPFTVYAGTTRTLKYRVLAYTGDLFTVDIWAYYQDYAG